MEDNKKIYLDKVLQWLINDTDVKFGKVKFPFLDTNISYNVGRLKQSFDPYHILFNDMRNYNFDYTKYCKEQFGLTYQESMNLFNRYINIISKKVLQGN